MSTTVDDIEAREEDAARRRATIRRYLRHPGFVIGALGISLLVLVALLAPWIAPHSPTRTDLMNTLAHPSATYWLGTDQFGRCVLSRLIHGAQVSLQVGFFVVLISLSAGTILGAIAGYAGGWVERALVAVIDILLAFPSFLLALALVAARGEHAGLDHRRGRHRLYAARRGGDALRRAHHPAPALHRGIARHRPLALEHRHAARHPECAAAGDRGRDRQRGHRDPGRGGALLPRPRRPAAERRPGAT